MFSRFRRTEEVVGFALSGGGSRGAIQVGALKALMEGGIIPQQLAGTSAGAVNATYFALYPDCLDRLETIWLALRRQDVFPGNHVRVLMNLARYGYVHAADVWEAFLRQQVGDARFEDVRIPCGVVAVRLSDGKRVVFDSGEIVPAIMASTAIPGVFPPYRVGDELYVDGGLIEYLPVPTLLERNATTIYALDCSSFSLGPGPYGSVADRCGLIGARAQVSQVTSLSGARGRQVHLLQPEIPEIDDARDFRYTKDMIAVGYAHARECLQNHPQTSSLPAVTSRPSAG